MASLQKKARKHQDEQQSTSSNDFKFDNPQPLKVKSGPRTNIINESDLFKTQNIAPNQYSNRIPDPMPMNSDNLPQSYQNTTTNRRSPQGRGFMSDDVIDEEEFDTPKPTTNSSNPKHEDYQRNFNYGETSPGYQGMSSSYKITNPQELADKIINEDIPNLFSNFDIIPQTNEDKQFSKDFLLFRRLASKLEHDVESEIQTNKEKKCDMANYIMTQERKIIDLYTQKHEYEKSNIEIGVKDSHNFIVQLNKDIRLNLHNWMYHDRLKKICIFKASFQEHMLKLDKLLYEYLEAKEKKIGVLSVSSKRDTFMRGITMVKDANKRLEIATVDFAYMLKDAKLRNEHYNRDLETGMRQIENYFENMSYNESI